MRAIYSDEVENGRDTTHARFGTSRGDSCGAFQLVCPATGERLQIIVSDGADWEECGFKLPRWEHVSVSHRKRIPTWEEMAWVKGLFFDDEECVAQFHPPRSRYVNQHDRCLHLWRPVGIVIPLPPIQCV